MSKFRFAFTTLAFLFLTVAFGAITQAQATRTWVSGVGDDVNPCSRTAPCKTFAGAISKTATNGEINCLDPGGFGAVTITKSITIDCHEIFASILNAGTTGTIVNYDFFAGTDTRRTVRLRNLNYNGANTGLNGIRIIGGAQSANSEVFVEDCLIDGQLGSPGHGIQDNRTSGGKLVVKNTTIRNNGGSGLSIVPSSGSTTIHLMVDNCHINNNNFGIAVGNGVRAQVNNTTAAFNTNSGYLAEGPTANSELDITSSVAMNNGTGITRSNTSVVRIYNNDIKYNGTAISGTTSSFGHNRIAGNTAVGTAPTPIGAATDAFGTQ